MARSKSFIKKHSLSIASAAIVASLIGLYRASNPSTHIRFSVKANRQRRQLFAVGYSFGEAQDISPHGKGLPIDFARAVNVPAPLHGDEDRGRR
jgi:hypothetical protein